MKRNESRKPTPFYMGDPAQQNRSDTQPPQLVNSVSQPAPHGQPALRACVQSPHDMLAPLSPQA